MHDVPQPLQLTRVVEAQPRHPSQLRLDRVATVAELLPDLVHDLETDPCELVQHAQLVRDRVGEEAVDHALVHTERGLRVDQIIRPVTVILSRSATRQRGKSR